MNTVARKNLLLTGAALTVIGVFTQFTGAPHPSRASDPVESGIQSDCHTLFGIDKTSGQLNSYRFDTSTATTIGTIKLDDDTILTNIDASAFMPGYTNIIGFWQDPSDSLCKLVYINVHTAEASIVSDDLTADTITAAVAVKPTTGSVLSADDATPVSEIRDHQVFAIQFVATPTSIGTSGELDGETNLNPNNSPHNEFTLITPDQTYTRDDLHQNTAVNGNGVFYEGPADVVSVKPKGNGNQNSLTVDGVPYVLENANLYTVVAGTDGMDVCVYNDHIHSNGKAMGKWYIEFTGGDGTVYEGDPPSGVVSSGTTSLINVDHKTGASTVVMALSRPYDGLAAETSALFYATSGQELYEIDPDEGTETLIGSIQYTDTTTLEFLGAALCGFAEGPDLLLEIDPATGATVGAPVDLGIDDLGTVIFMRDADPPLNTTFD